MHEIDDGLVDEFLLESVIPGIRKSIRSGDEKKIISTVMNRAHRDTMTGARFYSSEYCDNSKSYREAVSALILENKNCLASRALIGTVVRREINVGIIQKLVNMAVKYVYVLNACGFLDDYKIDLANCDCPLDSRILEKLSKDTHMSYTPWTKIKEFEEYCQIQDDIQDAIGADRSRLEYDFKFWGL